jgi:hypothetical protein
MPKLTFTTFDGVHHSHEVKPGITRIGRTADNDLQIDELELSSHHCEIRFDGESVVIRDLDSVGGTYIEGEPVREGKVTAGQVISLGTFLAKLEETTVASSERSVGALQPVRLADGSYSCLRHTAKRAAFECQKCFDLACDECVRWVDKAGGSREVRCGICSGPCRALDWSRLDLTTKEALKELFVPKKVKQAMDFWDQHKDKLKFKGE